MQTRQTIGTQSPGGGSITASIVKPLLNPRCHEHLGCSVSGCVRWDSRPWSGNLRRGGGVTPWVLDIYSHVMPGMQSDAAVKIDAGMRAALAGGRGDSLHRMHR